jgi:hypothetical protein
VRFINFIKLKTCAGGEAKSAKGDCSIDRANHNFSSSVYYSFCDWLFSASDEQKKKKKKKKSATLKLFLPNDQTRSIE